MPVYVGRAEQNRAQATSQVVGHDIASDQQMRADRRFLRVGSLVPQRSCKKKPYGGVQGRRLAASPGRKYTLTFCCALVS